MGKYDVVIVGGGISGTALVYVLSNYTNIKKIALFEKYDKVAQVNSKLNNNSQTLHFEDIETNYSLEKTVKVKKYADMVKNYLEKYFSKYSPVFSNEHRKKLGKLQSSVNFFYDYCTN